MEQRAAIKFCVKLKKTDTETLKCWKVRAVKNAYRERMCLNGIKLQRSPESVNAKIEGEKNVDCNFLW
jgi:hypothetical protein